MVKGAEATEGRGDPLLHIGYRLAHPLAEITVGIAIAQFMGLMGAGAGPTGHDRPATGTAFEQHLGFHGGGATGIQDLPCHHCVDH